MLTCQLEVQNIFSEANKQLMISQRVLTCSKLRIETLKQDLKFVPSSRDCKLIFM